MDRYVNSWVSGDPPQPPTTVYLIRHGESTHNAKAFYPADVNDASYIDADLTARGRDQASALADTVAALAPDLVVASPLTRALRTCALACARLPHAPVVHPACAERLAYSCDIGSPTVALVAAWPRADFAAVPQGAWWWAPAGAPRGAHESLRRLRRPRDGGGGGAEPRDAVAARAAEFRRWVVSRPERRVVVFSHGVYLRHLLAPSPRDLAPSFDNCEMRKVVL